jgi:cysteine-rich repeat protein
MVRFRLALCCLLFTGCLIPLEGDDGFDDPPRPPPPPPLICGDHKRQGGEACDDGNITSGDGCSNSCRIDGTVRVSWRLTTLAGETQPCPDGFDVAEVITQEGIWSAEVKRTFECAAGATDVVLEKRSSEVGHDIQVLIKTASGEVYGESEIDEVDVERRSDSSHRIVTDAGKIHVHWGVWVGNQPTFCSGVAAVDVVVRGAAGTVLAQSFPCDGYGDLTPLGLTPLLPVGTYSVDVSALRGGQSASATIDGIVVPPGGRAVLTSQAKLVF